MECLLRHQMRTPTNGFEAHDAKGRVTTVDNSAKNIDSVLGPFLAVDSVSNA